MIRIKLVMLLLLNTLISYSHTHDTEESMLTYSLSSTNDPTFLLPNAEPDNTLNNTNESKIRRKTHFFMTVGCMPVAPAAMTLRIGWLRKTSMYLSLKTNFNFPTLNANIINPPLYSTEDPRFCMVASHIGVINCIRNKYYLYYGVGIDYRRLEVTNKKGVFMTDHKMYVPLSTEIGGMVRLNKLILSAGAYLRFDTGLSAEIGVGIAL